MRSLLRKILSSLRRAQNEIVGGLVVVIIVALVTSAIQWFREFRTQEEPSSLASDPSEVDVSDYPLPSELNSPIPADDSAGDPPQEVDLNNVERNTDLSTMGAELWRIELPGQLQAAPIIAEDGSIVLVTASGVMLRIDTLGSELWRLVLGGASATRNYSQPVLTPDNHIYIVYDGELFSITDKGTIDWTFSKPVAGGLTAQPAIGSDGLIYLMTNDSTLLAVSPEGNEQWSQDLCQVMGGGTWPGPAVGSDGTVYGVRKGEDIYALEPTSGTIAWEFHTNDRMESTPVAGDDGLVYFASNGGRVLAMRPDGIPRWQSSVAGPPGYIQMIDAPVVRGPNGLIYVAPRHGVIYALDPATGEVQWSARIGGQGVGMNPVAVSGGGYVYARNLNGDLLCISPAGEVCWQISPASEAIRFSPPAAGPEGELYVGIDNELVAFISESD